MYLIRVDRPIDKDSPDYEYLRDRRDRYSSTSEDLHTLPTSAAVLPRLKKLRLDFSWGYDRDYQPSPNKNVILVVLRHLRCPKLSAVFLTSPRIRSSDKSDDIEALQACLHSLASDKPSSVRVVAVFVYEVYAMELTDTGPIITLLSHLPSLGSVLINASSGRDRRCGSLLTAALQWPAQGHDTTPPSAGGQSRRSNRRGLDAPDMSSAARRPSQSLGFGSCRTSRDDIEQDGELVGPESSHSHVGECQAS
ncbi:hypothetical protein BDV98DRAFT_566335 [Pterulicium gracile]|uniref:Uncharacterized protein n=1 Tax=Pterulicium gracile TaxID=1884261 RepID=A0A5C3QWL2_9AGAR|nr:hypothetical protein BDV98DRAFT_566335 [Pterula gracilis]